MYGPAVEEDFTVRWRQDAVQAAQERALAGTIWPDERSRLAHPEFEVDVFDRGTIFEVDGQVRCPHPRHSLLAQFGKS